MEKNTIIIYKDWVEAIRKRSKEVQLEILDALFDYGFSGFIPTMSEVAQMAFDMFRTQMDRDQERYEDICKKRSENQKKRWRDYKSKQKDTNVYTCIQTEASVSDNEYDNDILPTNVGENTIKEPLSKDKASTSTDESADLKVDWNKMLAFWNSTVKGTNLGGIRAIDDNRRSAIRARMQVYGKKAVVDVMQKAAASAFLNGDNDRNFIASFDWCMSKRNFPKILEGNYDNHKSKKQQQADAFMEDKRRSESYFEQIEKEEMAAISQSEYERLKALAAAGDEEAKRILHIQ